MFTLRLAMFAWFMLSNTRDDIGRVFMSNADMQIH